MTIDTRTYHPSKWIRVGVASALAVFGAITAMAFRAHIDKGFVALSIAMTLFAALALVDSFIARVSVEKDAVVIKEMLGTRRIPFSGVEKVSAEGGRTSLLMKTGKWAKLPEWMGSNTSARRTIADRLGR